MRAARLRLKLTPTTAEGLIAGYSDVETWYQQMMRSWSTHHQNYGQTAAPSLYRAMRRLADAYPDPATGANTAISSALHAEFTQVVIVPCLAPRCRTRWPRRPPLAALPRSALSAARATTTGRGAGRARGRGRDTESMSNLASCPIRPAACSCAARCSSRRALAAAPASCAPRGGGILRRPAVGIVALVAPLRERVTGGKPELRRLRFLHAGPRVAAATASIMSGPVDATGHCDSWSAKS